MIIYECSLIILQEKKTSFNFKIFGVARSTNKKSEKIMIGLNN